MGEDRELTEEDRQKIQKLLKTTEPGKVRLAIELTEETCNSNQLKDIYTDEIILAMVSSGDIELFARTASFFLHHNEHWDRFLQCASDTNVLTGMALKLRDKELRDFTHITPEAAGMLSSGWGSITNLDGLTHLSVAAARNLAEGGSLSLGGLRLLPSDIASALAEHKRTLWLNGLTKLSDEAAECLSKHRGETLRLCGLTRLSDAAAESLSKYKGALSLDGLTQLSDVVAESLSKHQGNLSLNGLTELSDAAAASLGQYQGNQLSLSGLTKLSDTAAAAIENKSLQLPSHIDRQIDAIVKRNATVESTLTPKQQAKIRKLIKTNDAGNVVTASELLAATAASEGDWIKLFPKTRIKELLNTFDPVIWNSLVPAMRVFPRVAEILSRQVADRVNTSSTIYGYHTRINEGLSQILRVAHDEVIELIGDLRNCPIRISAESLSDEEAERLAKYKGALEVNCLTHVSDTAADLLAKHPNLTIKLDALPESAAQILRDARYG